MTFHSNIASSGEELAIVAERFSKAINSTCASVEDAVNFLEAALQHIDDLAEAGQLAESYATTILALATFFRSGVDPRQLPYTYFSLLFNAVTLCGEIIPQIDTIAMGGIPPYEQATPADIEHWQNMTTNLFVLTATTYTSFREQNILDHPHSQAETMMPLVNNLDPELRSFNNNPIQSTTAIDIIFDCAARLAALGLIS